VNNALMVAVIPATDVEQGRTISFTVVTTDQAYSNLSPESSVMTYSFGATASSVDSIVPFIDVFTWVAPRTLSVWFYQITDNVTDAPHARLWFP
jgi:hypothetical protein